MSTLPSTAPTWYRQRSPAPPSRPPLTGQVEAEVCVVGGGLAGLATVLGLAERGCSAVLLEGGRFGDGASGRNGGMVSGGFAMPTERLARIAGESDTRELYRRSQEAMALIRRRIETHAIPCDPTEGVVVASFFDTPEALAESAADHNARFGSRLEFWPRERLHELYPSPRYCDGLYDPDGFHLNPLALCRGYADAAEAAGARLFEGSPALGHARRGDRIEIRTATGTVTAGQVVLCQSAYPPPLVHRIARAVLPVFTYVVVTAPLTGEQADVIKGRAAVYDDRFATGYYRLLPDGRLLWGGRISMRENPPRLGLLMRHDLATVYPQLATVPIEFAWSGRMGFTRSKMPLVRQVSPGFWVATGFGGHGLNTTTMAGEMVAAAIAQGDRSHELLGRFVPSWVGGRAGPIAAQAIYLGHAFKDRARLAWQRTRAARA